MCIIDEAAFIRASLLFQTIMPVTDQDTSSLVMISTPQGKKNYYTTLADYKNEHGEPIFHSLLVTHMCDNCRQLPKEEAVYCTHWRFLLPARKQGENEKESIRLHAGRLSDVMRERFAIVCGDDSSLFPESIVQRCFSTKLERYTPRYKPDIIFVSCDPGYHVSDTAYVAFANFPEGPKIIALGMFTTPDPEEQGINARAFFGAIQQKHLYRGVPIVFIPEGLPGFEGQHIATHVRQLRESGMNMLIMNEMKGDRPGVPTDHNVKRAYVFQTRAVLSFGAMRPTADMIAMTNKPLTLKDTEFKNPQDFLIASLAEQLLSMHEEVKEINDGIDEKRYITGKGPNQNDDMAMCLMIGVYYSTQFMISAKPEYARFRAQCIATQNFIYRVDPTIPTAPAPAATMLTVGA